MEDVHSQIQAQIDAAPVLLFMKGTAMFPQCGFSARVVQILKASGVPFKTVNVLEDPAIRDGIKSFSNWPTIPQLYVKGEFIGGCDIITEMYQNAAVGRRPSGVEHRERLTGADAAGFRNRRTAASGAFRTSDDEPRRGFLAARAGP